VRQDVVGLRVAAEHLLVPEALAVDVHLEDPAGSGDDLEDAQDRAPLVEDARDQPGRVRRRPSGGAVDDADVVLRIHDHGGQG
jgi:hypothetical protein